NALRSPLLKKEKKERKQKRAEEVEKEIEPSSLFNPSPIPLSNYYEILDEGEQSSQDLTLSSKHTHTHMSLSLEERKSEREQEESREERRKEKTTSGFSAREGTPSPSARPNGAGRKIE